MLEKDEYFGQRVVTLAGFCAWVVSPTDQALIRDAMVIKAEQKYRAMVRNKTVKGFVKPSRTLREKKVRESKRYAPFFRHIYAPIQKKGLLLKTRSVATLKLDLSGRAESLQSVLKLLTILHYVECELLPRGGYLPPSVSRGTLVYNRVDSLGIPNLRIVAQRAIEQHWARSRPSAGFLYASRHTQCEDGASLLDAILGSGLRFKICSPHFLEWFGKANFVTAAILNRLNDTRAELPEFAFVKGVKPIRMSPPHLEPANAACIEATFAKKTKAG